MSEALSEALHGKDVCIASKSATTQQQLSLGVDDPDANSSGEGCGLDGADVAASSGMSAQHAQQHESEEALAAGGIYDTVEVVTLETPQRAEVKAEVLLDPRVTLLPKQLGRGTFGRVVEGRYQGQRVVSCGCGGAGRVAHKAVITRGSTGRHTATGPCVAHALCWLDRRK